MIQGNLQVGNVYESSLYDIWKSEKLREVIEPSIELFANIECYDCSKFKECFYGKGICYVRAKKILENIILLTHFAQNQKVNKG